MILFFHILLFALLYVFCTLVQLGSFTTNIMFLDIIHLPDFFKFKTQRFGDWILSPS
jgi:hypothetical protein